jgi:phosphoglycerol transferase MdoB-like AlkP superfamily enzyme
MDWSRSLPWEFQRRGIPFWALHGNDGNYWNRKSAFTKMGMMAFLDRDRILVPKDTRWGVSDAVTFRKTVETARNHPGPMALFVITLTSHTPFDYAPAGSFPGTAPMERYFNSIAYLDRCLASLFRDLPMDSPWTVIMYGDHPSHMEGMGYQSLVDGKKRVPCWIFEWTSEGPKPMAFPKLTEKQRRDGSLEIVSLHSLLVQNLPKP